MTLEDYHRIRKVPTPYGPLFTKPGARGFPDPRYELLAELPEIPKGARVLDLNPGVGLAAYAHAKKGPLVEAIEGSRAAFRALIENARAAGFKAQIGLPWEAEEAAFDALLLALPAERGTRYVRAVLAAAGRALKPGGLLWVSGSKKKGFDRYFKEAKALIGYGRVERREGPYRLAVLQKEKTPEPPPLWHGFEEEVRRHRLRFETLPGVFSEDGVDPASRMLLEAIPPLSAGERVLDLGAGYGALSLPLAAEGAKVTALEDELVGVRSLEKSAQKNGLSLDARHSDVDEALTESEKFPIVVTNPPFHVGGNVVLDVAQAFVHAAYRHLEQGGRFYLVANPFLKYEPLIQSLFGNLETLREDRYKVLMAVRQRG